MDTLFSTEKSSDRTWMRLALEQACKAQQHGEVPVGAVLVRDGEVLATGHNQPIANHDPTAHAEMLALRAGAQRLGNYRLEDCELFVTLEPCAMCAQAMLHARLKRVVFGANEPKTGAAGSVLNLFTLPQLNHHTVVQGGVLANECATVLKDFFKERRQQTQQQAQPLRQDALRTPEARFAPVWEAWPHWQAHSQYQYSLPILAGLRWHTLDIPPENPVQGRHVPPVWLALHSPDGWWPQCAAWAQQQSMAGHRVLLPDLIGCGHSDKPKKWRWHTLALHTQILADWLQQLGLVQPQSVKLAVAPNQWQLAHTLQVLLPQTIAGTVAIPAEQLWQGCLPAWRDLPYPDAGHQAAQYARKMADWVVDIPTD